jgi:hypothetical protein
MQATTKLMLMVKSLSSSAKAILKLFLKLKF